jgi:hypothetical protein
VLFFLFQPLNDVSVPLFKRFHIGFSFDESDLGVKKLLVAMPDMFDLLFMVECFCHFSKDSVIILNLEHFKSLADSVTFLHFNAQCRLLALCGKV